MKNYFYIVCLFTILLAIPVNAQVGINTSTPAQAVFWTSLLLIKEYFFLNMTSLYSTVQQLL